MPEPTEPPRRPRFAQLALAGLGVLAVGVFLTGITWGLPSQKIDPYLFGGRPAWPGAKIAELTKADQRGDARRGADVDVDPLSATTQPVALNDTDEKRAAIILRYRLYTNQPDEMVTMMALASMKPGQRDFDPKLYQYGGLFVYPIGALLKIGSLAGLITLKTDLTYYLDHPEAFGRFYVVARCYVAAFGLAGVFAVFWVARRIAGGLPPNDETTERRSDEARVPRLCEQCGSQPPTTSNHDTAHTAVAHTRRPSGQVAAGVFAGLLAALLYVLMPVVINMAHEAKPHLPGAVLMLYAVLAAIRYVERGTWRWVAIAGLLCGAAFGMVLSSWPVFVVIPLMTLLRPAAWSTRAAHALAACMIGAVTYFVTNPYVLINLFVNPDLLRSNIGNTLAMFPRGGLMAGFHDAVGLIAEGASPLPAMIGAIGVVFLSLAAAVVRRIPTEASGPSPATATASLWLTLAPAALAFVPFAAAAADKPGEYGRFAVFIDVTLAIAAAVLVSRLHTGGWALRAAFTFVIAIATAVHGYAYLRHFAIDARTGGTRLSCARRIAELNDRFGPLTIGVFAESAPYCMPPLDLIGNKVYLLPRTAAPETGAIRPDVLVTAVDDVGSAPLGLWTVDYQAEFPGAVESKLGPAKVSWADKPFVLSIHRDLVATEVLSRHAR